MNIYGKLSNIQQELKAPKNQYNNFGGYSYRSCEDILEAVKPLLKKNDCILRLYDEMVQIGDRYYIKATAELTLLLINKDGDIKEEKIENTAYAREEETKRGMDGSQITGASSSYARKYALNGLFLIDDVKDSDTTNVGNQEEIKATKKQIDMLKKYYKGENLDKLLKINNIKEITDLPIKKASELISEIMKKEESATSAANNWMLEQE